MCLKNEKCLVGSPAQLHFDEAMAFGGPKDAWLPCKRCKLIQRCKPIFGVFLFFFPRTTSVTSRPQGARSQPLRQCRQLLIHAVFSKGTVEEKSPANSALRDALFERRLGGGCDHAAAAITTTTRFFPRSNPHHRCAARLWQASSQLDSVI